MRRRFVLGLLGFCGMLWAACREAAAPGRLDLDLSSAAAGPQAAFSFSCTQLTCQFTDQSVDSTAPIVAWHWLFGDGRDTTLQHPVHSYASPGTYNVILFVTDSVGASDSVAQLVTVMSDTTNFPPHAAFTFNCSGLTCQFTDSSSDADGVIVRYDWEFGDGATDTVPNPVHTYAAAGTYHVFHAVVDDGGLVDSVTQAVTVTSDTGGGGNQRPQAFFDFNCSALTCQFTDLSVDSGGAVVQWRWLFGDGGSDTTQHPTHTYAAPGNYTVTLFVRDNEGASDSTARLVPVSDTTGGAVLTLVAEGFRVQGVHHARLLWSGATVDSFVVFRDSIRITALRDTTYVDNIGLKGHRTYLYQVCQVGGGNGCSNTATVSFSRPSSTRR
jgi:PKD repeat protein